MRIRGRAVFFQYRCADADRGALARRPPGGWRRASFQGWVPRVLPVSEATAVLPQGSWWSGTVGVVRC